MLHSAQSISHFMCNLCVHTVCRYAYCVCKCIHLHCICCVYDKFGVCVVDLSSVPTPNAACVHVYVDLLTCFTVLACALYS